MKNLNLKNCASDIESVLQKSAINENHVKIFHIASNENPDKSEEPTQQNTQILVHKFLFYIYQRNVLASLIKYILLKPYISQFENFEQDSFHKGFSFMIHQRFKEIIFESVLCSFNGSNYDNYLLANHMMLIISKQKHQITFFKKGASLSTINIKCKKNVKPFHYKSIKKLKTEQTRWPMNLFIKDIRNLFANNMSLDNIGKMFKLDVSKLCFPYEQAVSIKKT